MNTSGYIKLFRSSMNDPLYLKEEFTKWQAWCDLILLAYYAPSEFMVRGVKVKANRGCVYMSITELATRWKWSRGKVARFIDYLEKDNKIKVKSSNVVNCISIVNYDKYQQNDLPVNEDVDIIGKMMKQIEELQSTFQEQSSKPKKKKGNPLITRGREVFEKRYSEIYDDSYYWQAKDSVAMDSLLKKISHSRKEKGMSLSDDDLISALSFFLSSISDPWIIKNYSVTNISSKYNEIVAQARASKNVVNETNRKKERVADATRIIANLEEKERADNYAIWGKK